MTPVLHAIGRNEATGEIEFDHESHRRLLEWADKYWRKKKRRQRMKRKKRRGWA